MLSRLGFSTGIRSIYSVSDQPSFVSEPWAIYPAKHKTNGKIVSVFIFDKSRFETQVSRLHSTSSSVKNPKVVISECYELIKYEVSQLSKLKHPQLLQVYEVLEETKSKFLFVTEPVIDNLVTVNPKDLDDLSIQKGLLQISKGLQFLHSYGSIIHLNLQPSSVYINNQGDWKLGGFKFLQNLNEISPQERENFYILNNMSVVPFANFNLNFTAPELIIDSHTKLDFANDIWSLGQLIYYLYNHQDLLINCFDANSISDYKQEFRKFEQKFYNHKPTELKYVLKDIPTKLYPLYPQILARYPHDRITLDQFMDSEFFNGSIIKAMWFIDEFSTKSVDEKLVFLKGLLEVDQQQPNTLPLISQFPPSFRSSKLLPLLIDLLTNELNVLTESVIDPKTDVLISESLTIVLKISETLSSLTFQDKVFDILFKDNPRDKKAPQTFTKLINSSVRTRLTLINNLDTIHTKSKDKQFVQFFKSIIDLVLTISPRENGQIELQIQLQEKFLGFIPQFVDKLDFPYIKNTLVPLLCQVFKTTTILSTKLSTIDTFEGLVDKKIIDKIIVNEQLFPIMKNLKSRDKRIVTKMLNFFFKLATSEHINLDLEAIVESIIPQSYSLAFGCNDCNQLEFNQFISIINSVQKQLVEKKLSTLLKTSSNGFSNGHKGGKNEAVANNNFEALLQTQTIHDVPDEINAPKGKVMQPKRKSVLSTAIPTKSNSAASTNTTQVRNSDTLRPRPKPRPVKKPTEGLAFGATNTQSNTTNNRLLNTLNSTFDKKQDDDDFDDFQSAASTSVSELSSSRNGTINWQGEVNKMKTLPNTPTTAESFNVSRSQSQPQTKNTNYPPGFNTNMVLSPKSSSINTNVKSSSSAFNGNANNSDLLDLL
ncbi:protein kinase, putative [Candida dubliniensis CD36]|uniref:Protein kinase, putative n=1 Tax=Candida dubliniensis (strain CD36 / ATCC MYA-646 / CBS 7987 / NCPF 3949 / NRRL Y-17841) TaxID=573826 RepID=B9W7Q1_CANDC|nr:protein kinase, putative [Candida dubliniensis CD36]CAX44712.1 protein kinase, putative [Candida dubliniensis CD36]